MISSTTTTIIGIIRKLDPFQRQRLGVASASLVHEELIAAAEEEVSAKEDETALRANHMYGGLQEATETRDTSGGSTTQKETAMVWPLFAFAMAVVSLLPSSMAGVWRMRQLVLYAFWPSRIGAGRR
jgi:hypothetical protein